MGRIGKRFQCILVQNKKAFIPFFTAFYPSKDIFVELLLRADDAGADFIEIGIPFSDPLADGKMIQHSSQWVLRERFRMSEFFEETRKIRVRLRASIILMSYFNPLLRRGIPELAAELDDVGVDGVIVSDVPLEESYPIQKSLSGRGIDLIHLLTPTTEEQRMKRIFRETHGFVYVVSLTGTTGMREKLPSDSIEYIKKIRKETTKPLCLGFGISGTHQARMAAKLSDGVIIGSALVNRIKGREFDRSIPKEIGAYMKKLREAV